MTDASAVPAVDLSTSMQNNGLGSLEQEWSLAPAVVTSFDTAKMIAFGVFDGDAAVIPMISLVGYVATNARVFVLRVPPSGNYIIGGGNLGTGDWIAYAGPKTSNTAASSSTDVGVLSISGIPTIPGNIYRIETTTLNMTPSASGLTAEARLRYEDDGSAADGTSTQIGSAQLEGVATFVPRGSSALVVHRRAETTQLSVYLGWALVGGVGTVTLQGSSNIPVMMYVRDLGRFPAVAGTVL